MRDPFGISHPEGSSEITTSIGGRCKVREDFSRPVLITRGLDLNTVSSRYGVLRVREELASTTSHFPVVIAAGKHLFPFRTEQLSPPAPMVLGGQPPGRVGRRGIFFSWAPQGAHSHGPTARVQAARTFSRHAGSSCRSRRTRSPLGGCVTKSAASPSSANGLAV